MRRMQTNMAAEDSPSKARRADKSDAGTPPAQVREESTVPYSSAGSILL